MTPPVTALICEDEPLARQRLRDLLADSRAIEVVGEAKDGLEAVAQIDALKPALVFLDIRMPVHTGLEVLAKIRHRPAVIFTTAYDRFAVAAFELAAVDYLLKPFGQERLRVAVARAMDQLDQRSEKVVERVEPLLRADKPLERLFVRDRGRIVLINIETVSRFEARDDCVAIFADTGRYLMTVTLGELEARLDSSRFVRVHRTHLVNLDYVTSLEPYDQTRLRVEMRDGTKVLASRSRSKELRGLAR